MARKKESPQKAAIREMMRTSRSLITTLPKRPGNFSLFQIFQDSAIHHIWFKY